MTLTRHVSALCVLLLAPGGALGRLPPRTEPHSRDEVARRHQVQGVDHYGQARYAEAIVSFGHVRRLLAPEHPLSRWATAYSAMSLAALRRCVEAIDAFDTVTLSRGELGPLSSPYDAAERSCRVSYAGQLAQAGRCRAAEAQLTRLPETREPLQQAEVESVRRACLPEVRRPWTWVAMAGGLAFLGLGAGMSVYAAQQAELAADKRAEEQRTNDRKTGQALLQEAADAETRRNAGIGVAVAAGALGLAGVIYASYRFAVGPTSGGEPTSASLVPLVGGGVVVWGGSF